MNRFAFFFPGPGCVCGALASLVLPLLLSLLHGAEPSEMAPPAEVYPTLFDPGVMGPPATPEVVAAAIADVTKPMPRGPFAPTWASIEEHYRTPAWFEDAKFGIFMHWGLYAVPAHHNEWYEKHMYGNSGIRRWHTENFGPPEKFGYKDFIPLFKADKFDAAAWADLFRRAGARYIIPTAQHHDNFALWDSGLTTIDARDMGPKRDLIGELAVAVRRAGMKFGVSNHGIENFTFIEAPEEMRTAMAAAKADLYDPAWAEFYRVAERSDAALTRFLTDWINRNLELIDKYQVDMLWFDNGVNGAKDRMLDPLKLHVAAYYYNRAREWDKEVAISTKGLAYAPSGDHMKQIGSIIDFEKIGRRSPVGIRPGPWQVDHPIGTTWGYTTNMRVSSPATVVRELIETVARGGNYLLNLAPTADGTIPQAQQDTLLALGRWLEVNGDAIYTTRAWTKPGEGALTLGRDQRYTGSDIRFTTKNGALYAIFMAWPENGDATITSLASGVAPTGRVRSVTLLGDDEELEFTQDVTGLHVTFPQRPPCEHAFALKITGLAITSPYP